MIGCDPDSPLMETEVAFVVVQLKVEVWPGAMEDGLAVKERIVGASDRPVTVSETTMVFGALEPAVSVTVITSLYVPFARLPAAINAIDTLNTAVSRGPKGTRGPSRASQVWVLATE